MTQLQSRWLAPALVLAGLSSNLLAVDGVILIDQSRALAGNVTPGDAPGFPVTISLPGSYRLSGSLTVPDANTTAIKITADNVTIDLNGFSILGPTVCVGSPVTSCSPTGTGYGVQSLEGGNTAVLNGAIRGMGATGVFLIGRGRYRVEKLVVSSNGDGGILAGGSGTVSGNIVANNRVIGIYVFGGTVNGNTVTDNGGLGISGEQSTITGNTTSSNSTGISALCPSTIVNNTATGNTFKNLQTYGAGCAVANNAAP